MGVASVGLDVGSSYPGLAIPAHIRTFQNVRELHQSLGTWKWERAQQHAFDDGEDGSGGANSKREHQHGRGREAGGLQQMADCDS